MTYHQLTTTPDIDLMQRAESPLCGPEERKAIVAHLSTLGLATVNLWLRQQGYRTKSLQGRERARENRQGDTLWPMGPCGERPRSDTTRAEINQLALL